MVAFPGIAGMLPHIKAGKLRALGVSGAKRSPELPAVRTRPWCVATASRPPRSRRAFSTSLLIDEDPNNGTTGVLGAGAIGNADGFSPGRVIRLGIRATF